MKKTALSILLFLTVPFCLLAQFGGGNGNGEMMKPVTTLQLDGTAVAIFFGGNGRGEQLTAQITSQINGDTISVSIYGGGNGRGETTVAVNNNQINGSILNIFGGGDGRGEIQVTNTTNQLNGDTLSIYGGGNGRGETFITHNNSQINGDTLNIYGGGDGRGEITTTQNTLQLNGLVASIYLGGDGRGETATTTTNVALPIQLLSFGASLVDKQVKVQWQTATEINTAFFVVEKSLDGINWKPIGQVKAAGNSTAVLSYDFLDTNVAEGTNFYRLKPTDIDGRSTYSAVATVNYHLAVTAPIIAVYPNPVKYQFTLQISGATIVGKLNVTLVNVNGQTVLQKQNLSGNTHVFDMGMLAKGTYFLMINNNGAISTVKVLKE